MLKGGAMADDVTTSGRATPNTTVRIGWRTWLAWSLLSALGGVIARVLFYLVIL